jgi:sigma-E factor negative regulatory protein RseC
MLKEKGLVTEVVGNIATVTTINQLACSSCKVADTCGNGIVEKYLSGQLFSSQINNTINAKVGETVFIQIPKSSITKASLIVYLIPLLGIMLFAIAATLLNLTENLTILSSLSGLVLGMLVTKFYNHKILKKELYQPKMVSIIGTKTSKSDINLIIQ